MSIAQGLEQVLRTSAKAERPILEWLKYNPLVPSQALARGRFRTYVVAEFPFGNDFRADFVLLSPFSGGWDVHFVELEPANEKLFTSTGNPAKRLATAIAQVGSWKIYVEKNRDAVLKNLSKFAKERELLSERNGREPIDSAGWPLYRPQSWLIRYYHILIGRRTVLKEKDMERKTSFLATQKVEVLTYDRLLDAARNLIRTDEFRESTHPPCDSRLSNRPVG